jgi:hypothetical protein
MTMYTFDVAVMLVLWEMRISIKCKERKHKRLFPHSKTIVDSVINNEKKGYGATWIHIWSKVIPGRLSVFSQMTPPNGVSCAFPVDSPVSRS